MIQTVDLLRSVEAGAGLPPARSSILSISRFYNHNKLIFLDNIGLLQADNDCGTFHHFEAFKSRRSNRSELPSKGIAADLAKRGLHKMGAGSASKQGEISTTQTQLPVELQGQIGKRLREAYNELVSEPVPDRFVQLLRQLKQREDQGRGGKT